MAIFYLTQGALVDSLGINFYIILLFLLEILQLQNLYYMMQKLFY